MEYQGAISRAWGAFFFWLNAYTFDKDLSEDEINDLIFGKLVSMDYYANCVMPRTPSGLNERTPFVEYVVSTRRRRKNF
jgi:hypothetical protein